MKDSEAEKDLKETQNFEEPKQDQENDTKFESEIKYDDSDGGLG